MSEQVLPEEEEAITEGTAEAPEAPAPDESTQAPNLAPSVESDGSSDAPSSDAKETPEDAPASEGEAPEAKSTLSVSVTDTAGNPASATWTSAPIAAELVYV